MSIIHCYVPYTFVNKFKVLFLTELISKPHFCQRLVLGNCLGQGMMASLLILKSGDLRKPIPYYCYHYASVPWLSIEKVTTNLFLFAIYTALLFTLLFVHSYIYPIQIAASIQTKIPNKRARVFVFCLKRQ